MQQPRIRQQMHSEEAYAQKLGAKSGWRFFLPALGWVMVLAAALAAVVGIGKLPQTSAAGAGVRGGANHESEAALGAKHGQRRKSGCILIVPRQPLTARGLATPYQLTGSDVGGTACQESNSSVAAFAQAAVLDPATGQISIYNPLVIDKGKTAAVAPVVPTLPAHAVVAIWFGSNGTMLRLQGADFTALRDGQCVDGLGQSAFGQVAYCHAPAFFSAANRLIQMKKLTPPALGIAKDGMTCPSVRDFSVVDQDQSDNVTSTYRITQDGALAQDTAATAAQFPDSSVLKNGSDNRLVAVALDAALGCSPWKAPDLADPGQMVTALPLDELQAAMYQAAPVALVPSGDPMTLVNGHPNLMKQNLYRIGVDQPWVTINRAGDRREPRLLPERDAVRPRAPHVGSASGPSRRRHWIRGWPIASTPSWRRVSLSTIGSDELNCTGLLHQANPVQLTEDSSGVVVDATFSAPTNQAPASANGAAVSGAGA